MKHRTSLGLAVTLVLTGVLLVPAVLQGQKGKPPKPSPPPTISTSVWLDSGAGAMIRAEGDPASPYAAVVVPELRAGTTDVYDYYLAFWFRYPTSDPANRSLVFDFGLPPFAVGDKLECYPAEDYRLDRGKVPYQIAVPTFLTTGRTEGAEAPLWVSFYTGEEWTKDANGVWGSLGHVFNLGPYVNGELNPLTTPTRYVTLRTEFRPPEFVGVDMYVYVAHNGPIKTPSSFGTTLGLAEVTPAEGGGFVLKPVSAAVLSGSTLPTAYLYSYGRVQYPLLSDENQANLTIKIPLGAAAGFKAWYGICDAGTFNMPYAVTVKK